MDVVVAGAGPTGLVVAIELARRGVGVRVVDRAAEFAANSRSDSLRPRTLEVFEDLGVLDAVLAAGSHKYPMRVHHNGVPVAERSTSRRQEPTPDRPYPNMWLLGQARTEQVLRDRLAEFGVRVELDCAVTGVEQDEHGVSIQLHHNETVRAAYLVAADGGKSFVRRALGVAFEGCTDESTRMMICDVLVDGLDRNCSHWFARAEAPGVGLALVPVSGQPQFQVRAALDADREPGTLAELQALLDRFCDGHRVRLRELTWSTVLRSNLRVAQRFRVGRVLLAGDAAHVHPPTGSQGLNTGVQDAHNLGWKLAAAVSGAPEAELLLDSYEQERRAVALRVHAMITDLMRSYTGRTAHPAPLEVSYRDSPLSVDERPAPSGLRAGDRAPDAPLLGPDGRPTRLFELFRGPHATLLAFGEVAADRPHWPGELRAHHIAPAGTPGEFVDTAGHAFAAYGVAPGTQVLVRPDGHIGRVR
ncbi:FAD-dependent monooxygenase [Kutzneria albida]|uniref:FAD-binding domain-containing protein n=1 Tax=Kutzneria albida DSM 43870 TaxID=1449976 RepID=W5WEM4_9PSEU|nr:FAD-dependent monooxygenase [Kutzneria albida]AHH99302.1 hypothetical protein KALB_5941 [Kutzneria albida DSM 43870]